MMRLQPRTLLGGGADVLAATVSYGKESSA
jgi:hypothetical protein